MINLRYHIVSIAAVFLALGIGVAFGGAFLDRAPSEALEGRVRSLDQRLSRESQRLDETRDQLSATDEAEQRFSEETFAALSADSLTSVPVLAVVARGTDDQVLARTELALDSAGAKRVGVLWIDERATPGPDDTASVAKALGLDSGSSGGGDTPDVGEAVVAALVDVIDGTGVGSESGSGTTTTGPIIATTTAPGSATDTPSTASPSTATPGAETPSTATPGAETPSTAITAATTSTPTTTSTPGSKGTVNPLEALRTSGIGELDLAEGVREVPSGALALVVWGEGAEPVGERLLLPLLSKLGPATDGKVLVAEARRTRSLVDEVDAVPELPERGSMLAEVVKDRRFADTVSTVDNLDRPFGLLAVVWGLAALTDGEHGNYGQAPGIDRLVPAPRR